jgi:hypothetical protein
MKFGFLRYQFERRDPKKILTRRIAQLCRLNPIRPRRIFDRSRRNRPCSATMAQRHMHPAILCLKLTIVCFDDVFGRRFAFRRGCSGLGKLPILCWINGGDQSRLDAKRMRHRKTNWTQTSNSFRAIDHIAADAARPIAPGDVSCLRVHRTLGVEGCATCPPTRAVFRQALCGVIWQCTFDSQKCNVLPFSAEPMVCPRRIYLAFGFKCAKSIKMGAFFTGFGRFGKIVNYNNNALAATFWMSN